METWEAAAVLARTMCTGQWARIQSHKTQLLLPSTLILPFRLQLGVSKKLCICRSQSCEAASLSPLYTDECGEEEDAPDFSAIPSSLLAAEREEAKAVLSLFLRKQGLSNALAARTINKSDLFIDYLVSKLHTLHRSRYIVGRELTTLEIRSALVPYLEALLEEHGETLVDMIENFPDPPGTTDSTSIPLLPRTKTKITSTGLSSKKERAIARVNHRDSEGGLYPQVQYLLDLGMDLDKIEDIARTFPPFTYYSVDRKIKPVVEFLLELGVPQSDIPKILRKRPQLCGISFSDNLKPMMNYLENIGVDKTQWAKVISRFPALLTSSRNKVKALVDYLHKLGVPEKNIGKILTRNPRIISYSVDDKLIHMSEYFSSIGIDVASLIQRCPQNFGLSIEANLNLVTEFFLENGYTIDEFATMINRYGAIYTLSLGDNLVPKWEFFLTMGYPKSDLVKFPHYFGYNLERRIKPRYERTRECGVCLGLNQMLSVSGARFEKILQRKMEKNGSKL